MKGFNGRLFIENILVIRLEHKNAVDAEIGQNFKNILRLRIICPANYIFSPIYMLLYLNINAVYNEGLLLIIY